MVLLHALFAVVTQWTLQAPVEQLSSRDDKPLQMRFVPILTTPAPVPAPPPMATPPPHTRTSRHAERAGSIRVPQVAMAATAGAPASALRLYSTDGRILLPASAASSSASSVPNTLKGNAQIMRGYDPLHYKATPFEPYFPPLDESAGGAAVRRVVNTVIKTKEVDLPRGIHLQCKTVLGIPTPDCKIPPPPASPKDGDERLSMAPAAATTVAHGATAPPTVAACIKLYRAGKPLPWGCPVDTPTRAVDAELKKQHTRPGKQH